MLTFPGVRGWLGRRAGGWAGGGGGLWAVEGAPGLSVWLPVVEAAPWARGRGASWPPPPPGVVGEPLRGRGRVGEGGAGGRSPAALV